MFDPEYMETQSLCSGCAGCGICATCAACLVDGPIPDFEVGATISTAAVVSVASW